jgi:hypothetical protein
MKNVVTLQKFKKFEMTLLFSGAWGKMIYGKNLEAKNLVTLSLEKANFG